MPLAECYPLGVDLVVFCMGTDKLHIDNLSLVEHFDYQTIVISLDIEADTAITKYPGCPIIYSNISQRTPLRFFSIREPCS